MASSEVEEETDSNKKGQARLIREVYNGGQTKTCLYQRGGMMFTFPQWKDELCPLPDLETGLVDTRGLPF